MSSVFADEGSGKSFFRDMVIRPRIEEFSHFARRSSAARPATEEGVLIDMVPCRWG